jgi:hypothetical protein
MSLLIVLLTHIGIAILAFMVGFVEYYLALKRTLALVDMDAKKTFYLVLAEGILPWLGLGSFLLVTSIFAKILIVIFMALGGGIAAIMVIRANKKS